MSSELDNKFAEAFKKMSEYKKILPPDVMLKFYAYYKQANFGSTFVFNNEDNLRSAFKANAWMQIKGMSADSAKQHYIELANTILNTKK